jgi:uncharacterized protein with HEPN domain
MSRDWQLYLQDVLQSCEKIGRYTAGMTQQAFLSDDRTSDAVVRNLEIIGIAAKRLPEEIRAQIPTIDWSSIAGMRDIVAHEYFRIDSDILWDVVQNKVRELENAVRMFLKE